MSRSFNAHSGRLLGAICALSCMRCSTSEPRSAPPQLAYDVEQAPENLVINGTFDQGLDPNGATKLGENFDLIAAPEALGYETRDTHDGQGGAARVTLAEDPVYNSHTHNTGLSVQLSSWVTAGTWLRVGFYAKWLSGSSLVEVQRSLGGSATPGFVSISRTWRHYETYIQLQQDGPAVIFSLARDARNTLQPVQAGSFLIDDITVSIVTEFPPARCGEDASQACQVDSVTCGASGDRPCTPPCAEAGSCGPTALDWVSVRPVAAYSLAHRLRALYLGPALRVRRASDNEQASVGFDEKNHVDAAAITAFCGDSDCHLVTLYDQSGYSRDLDQPAPVYQNKIYDGATRAVTTFQGQPVLHVRGPRFYVQQGGMGLTASGEMTFAYVGRFDDAGANGNPFPPFWFVGSSNGMALAYEEGIEQLTVGNGVMRWPSPNNTRLHTSIFQHVAQAPIAGSSLRIDGAYAPPSSQSGTDDAFGVAEGAQLVVGPYGPNQASSGADLQTIVAWNLAVSGEDVTGVELGLGAVTDACPDDPAKTAPGACGCGVADTDSDGDGTLDCDDDCPADPGNVSEGSCGCLGKSSLKPGGTACFDAPCSESAQCDGAGHCGSLAACGIAGHTCTAAQYDDHTYLFCDGALPWDQARAACQSRGDMDLVRVDASGENRFLAGKTTASPWLGGSDAAGAGTWVWSGSGRQFWRGDGAGTFTAYASFAAGEPDAGSHCAALGSDGHWTAEDCASARGFVCETRPRPTPVDNALLARALDGISDPAQRSRAAYAVFAAQKTACNVLRGTVVSDAEQWLQRTLAENLSADELPRAMQSLEFMCSNLPSAALRATYLQDLAGADPLDPSVYAERQSISICDTTMALTDQTSRLRANFCANSDLGADRDVNLGSELYDSFRLPDGVGVSRERHRAAGAPVVIGLDELSGFSQFGDVKRDRDENRIVDHPPGDGYSMYGVATNIPCVTGSCDASLGHLCSSEAPGHAAKGVPDPNCTPVGQLACPLIKAEQCIAYPVVKFDQKLPLIGYNFWDPCQAQLLMRPLNSSAAPDSEVYTIPVAGVDANGEPAQDDTGACTPSPDGVRLAAAGNPGASIATFELGGAKRPAVPRNRFYTLQMANQNGALSTQHDVQERMADHTVVPPRTLHVCWDCDPNVPDTNCPRTCAGPDDTKCTIARCTTNVAQSCEEDGCAGYTKDECDPNLGRNGQCPADLWPTPPRALTECHHQPHEEPRCAETPLWVTSSPHPRYGHPIIFLAEAAPLHQVELQVERIFCQQETGFQCDFCNDDDLHAILTASVGTGSSTRLVTWQYKNSFDQGQARAGNDNSLPAGEIGRLRIKVAPNESIRWILMYNEDDSDFGWKGTLNAAISAAIGGYFGGVAGGALSAFIGGLPALAKDPDEMGGDMWVADIERLQHAYGDSRSMDLLLHGHRLPLAPVSDEHTRLNLQTQCNFLMHPFDLSYRNDLAAPSKTTDQWQQAQAECASGAFEKAHAQCGSGYAGPEKCDLSLCFAGRCTSAAVGADGCHPQDALCGLGSGPARLKGFRERRDIMSDDESGPAHYVWDLLYRFQACDATLSPDNPDVCEELP